MKPEALLREIGEGRIGCAWPAAEVLEALATREGDLEEALATAGQALRVAAEDLEGLREALCEARGALERLEKAPPGAERAAALDLELAIASCAGQTRNARECLEPVPLQELRGVAGLLFPSQARALAALRPSMVERRCTWWQELAALWPDRFTWGGVVYTLLLAAIPWFI